YLARLGSVASAKDLLRCTLLEMRQEPWQAWFKAAGLRHATPTRGPVLSNDFSLLLTAALSGQGVALARSCLVQRHLASGSLVRLHDLSIPSRKAYYAVHVREAMASPEIRAFLKWLKRACDVE